MTNINGINPFDDSQYKTPSQLHSEETFDDTSIFFNQDNMYDSYSYIEGYLADQTLQNSMGEFSFTGMSLDEQEDYLESLGAVESYGQYYLEDNQYTKIDMGNGFGYFYQKHEDSTDEYLKLYRDTADNSVKMVRALVDPNTSQGTTTVFDAGSTVSVNTYIGDERQGYTGDCWLLTAINSLNMSENGRVLLSNAITDNQDGSYTVELKGTGKSYTVTNKEIMDAKNSPQYSKGDDDIILFELAYEKALNEAQNGEINIPQSIINPQEQQDEGLKSIHGGNFYDFLYLLTGNVNNDNFEYKIDPTLDDVNDVSYNLKNNPERYSYYFALRKNDDSNTMNCIIKDEDGVYHDGAISFDSHAFLLKSSNDDINELVLVDPYNSKEEVYVQKDEFMKYVKGIGIYDWNPEETSEEETTNQ